MLIEGQSRPRLRGARLQHVGHVGHMHALLDMSRFKAEIDTAVYWLTIYYIAHELRLSRLHKVSRIGLHTAMPHHRAEYGLTLCDANIYVAHQYELVA